PRHWAAMEAALDPARRRRASPPDLLDVDRACHEIIWEAAGNRFLTATLDTLYAQSDRLWHLYLNGVADTSEAVDEHDAILDALRAGDADRAGSLVEAHVRAFDAHIRAAVARRLASPVAIGGR
nr:FadR family transcriptional regulator [Acidimicrobiia bacterium]